MINPTVLVLGINGLSGRLVFKYLKANHKNIYGTLRSDKNLKLTSENVASDMAKIVKKLKKINFVINCIGVNRITDENKTDAISTNSILPIRIAQLSHKYNYKIIHISTDAIFKSTSGKVNEFGYPSPEGIYALTKYLGEDDCKNTLNIRTSLIGLSPDKKTGLTEHVLGKKGTIEGFVNQKWSGCTSLQFAKLAEYLIYNSEFNRFRSKSSVYHFAPLGPISKYELILNILKVANSRKKLKKTVSPTTITRYLSSMFLTRSFLKKFNEDISLALKEMFDFEKVIR